MDQAPATQTFDEKLHVEEMLEIKVLKEAGLEKTRFKKKTSPVVFFLGFWVFLSFFCFFLYLPRRESFLGLFQFQEYF